MGIHRNKNFPANTIQELILIFRGYKVILDRDLALLYGVSVGRLNEAVKRNRERFPADFMFQLTEQEINLLKVKALPSNLISQIAISSSHWGGRRHLPYAFTEQGVAMLSSVLRSKKAVQVNILRQKEGRIRRRCLAENYESLCSA